MSETRTIMHIDMNAFFASVEQQANPALRGKPVAVIGSGARTIVTTASYEARAFGVKTGMTVYEARRRCPEIEIVVGDNRKYTSTSTEIVAMLRDYTPQVEVFSIDEAFLDLSGSLTLFDSAERVASLIKARIRHRFGLTCSIGIAPNKLLAKLASEMKKPDGLTVIPPGRVSEILEHLPVGELCGVGRKTAQQLELLGIRSCGELGRFPEAILRRKFGIVGARLRQMGQGIDLSPVVPEEEAAEVKSVGHSTTLARDLTTRAEICACLLQLSEMVGRRARRYGVTGRTVHLTIRYADFSTFGVQLTLSEATAESGAIYAAACRLLDGLVLTQPVRLLGVRINGLQQNGGQLELFGDGGRRSRATGAMDAVNDRFGSFTVTYGSVLEGEGRGSQVISPAWRPQGVRNVEVE
jgi:DNA polymerase-4